MRLADKVEHGEAVFACRMTEAAAQLLEKHGETFGGAQEQYGVDFGNVETLAEYIAGEEEGDLPRSKLIERTLTVGTFRFSHQQGRANAVRIELRRHELGVTDGDAEADAAHAVKIRLVAGQRTKDRVHTLLGQRVGTGVDLVQGLDVVFAAFP